MARIVTVHSNRGGTGKSHLAANLASLIACSGARVGLLDTALQSAGLHQLFGLTLTGSSPTLATYLGGGCEIEDALYDVSSVVDAAASGGQLLLVPSSANPRDTADLLNRGYDLGLLADACSQLIERHDLDMLLLDTHPGLSNESSLSIALADIAVLVVRPDGVSAIPPPGPAVSTYQWPRRLVVVNMLPSGGDEAALRDQLRADVGVDPVAVIPFSNELGALNSERVFACDFPQDRLVGQFRRIVGELMGGSERPGPSQAGKEG